MWSVSRIMEEDSDAAGAPLAPGPGPGPCHIPPRSGRHCRRIGLLAGVAERGVEALAGSVQPLLADVGELLAALPERQRLFQAQPAGLQPADHLGQLLPGLLVPQRRLAHGRHATRSTGAVRRRRRASRRRGAPAARCRPARPPGPGRPCRRPPSAPPRTRAAASPRATAPPPAPGSGRGPPRPRPAEPAPTAAPWSAGRPLWTATRRARGSRSVARTGAARRARRARGPPWRRAPDGPA